MPHRAAFDAQRLSVTPYLLGTPRGEFATQSLASPQQGGELPPHLLIRAQQLRRGLTMHLSSSKNVLALDVRWRVFVAALTYERGAGQKPTSRLAIK